jgi:hypothetical protein
VIAHCSFGLAVSDGKVMAFRQFGKSFFRSKDISS